MQQELLNLELRLEDTRSNIEEKYQNLKGSKYEAEFRRRYMSRFRNNLMLPYKEKYIYALSEYLTAIKIRQIAMEDFISACETNDISPALLDQLLEELEEVFEILKSVKEIFDLFS